MWHSRLPPFMANAILNFHFDFLHPSLIAKNGSKGLIGNCTAGQSESRRLEEIKPWGRCQEVPRSVRGRQKLVNYSSYTTHRHSPRKKYRAKPITSKVHFWYWRDKDRIFNCKIHLIWGLKVLDLQAALYLLVSSILTWMSFTCNKSRSQHRLGVTKPCKTILLSL